MRNDGWSRFGINWNEILQKEILSRAAICPFFEEAGALLRSAGETWIGRLGAGRQRGKELTALGNQAVEFAQNGFNSALYWTSDCPIPPDLSQRDDMGYNLGQHHPRRSYSPKHTYSKDETLRLQKNTEAASILVAGAVVLIQEQIPLILKTGDSHLRGKTAKHWEDRLETLGEHPAVLIMPTLSADAIEFLWLRAVARTAEKLCFGFWRSIQMMGLSHEDMSPEPDTWRGQKIEEWLKRGTRYKKAASVLYGQFVDAATDNAAIKQSLLSVEDEGFLDNHSRFHLSNEDDMQRCEKAIEAWLKILHRYFGGGVEDMAPAETEPQALSSDEAGK